jgi:Fe-S cluster assembly protein SufD
MAAHDPTTAITTMPALTDSLVAPLEYGAELERLLAAPRFAGLSTLGDLRRRAFERFVELGFPTVRQEDWRFTNVAPVARLRFGRPPASYDARAIAGALAPHRLAGTRELVFVDGRFAPELSSPALASASAAQASTGAAVGLVADALSRLDAPALARLEPHLGRHANFVERPFAALASALFEEAAVVMIPKGVELGEPVHVLWFATATPTAKPAALFPRLLVVAGEASRATVVESHISSEATVRLVAPVTEIVAGAEAQVDHYKLQREGRESFHFGLLQVALGRAANVSTQTFSLGAAIARHDVEGVLDGEGAEATMNGLYLVDDRQLADFHLRVDHAKPHTTSHELFKGVLNGRGRGVFNGRIFVHPQAQKTDAKQTSRNLLLSDEALVNANPQLEIFADDVKCSHGSTIGQLDELAVFYLRSRGIGLEAARSLLTYAFASDLVERVRVPALHRALQEFLLGWIPEGDVVREAI